MNVRKATRKDVDVIHELGKSVDEFAVSDETVNFWPKEILLSAVQSDNVLILVAEDESVAGFMIATYSGLRKALIENIYVRTDKRGHGVGEKLLEAALQLLLKMGCEYVVTLVPPDAHSAIGLYQRSGFNQGEIFVWLDKALTDNFHKHHSA